MLKLSWGFALLGVVMMVACGRVATPTPSPVENTAVAAAATSSPTLPDPVIPPTPEQSQTPFSVATSGSLVIHSEPSGATVVFVDAGISANTPYSTTLLPGIYTIDVFHSSYQVWTETIEVQSGASNTVTVTLLPNNYQYFTLEELGPTMEKYLVYLAWEEDGQSLIYAVTSDIQEPQKWSWWRYEIFSGETQEIAPPPSMVTEEVRQVLNLCPLDQTVWNEPVECASLSRLYESPYGRIAYSPIPEDPTNYGKEEFWLANFDGTNAVKVADFSPSYVHWSGDGRWLVAGQHFPGLPGQETHYLVATDGSFIRKLTAITGHDQFMLNGLFPEFSPDGKRLAYIGSEVNDSLEESDYKLYVLDLNTLDVHLISDKIGLFQWSHNDNGLYVLDRAMYPLKLEEILESSGPRETNLYYIDLTQVAPQERIVATSIPYYHQSSFGTWLWAFSPTAYSLAYVGFLPDESLGVLLFFHPTN